MTNALEINTLLHEARDSGRPIRFSYPGSEVLTARVGQVGSTWVEVNAFDSSTGKYGERWLKISLIVDAGWSPSEAIRFPEIPKTGPSMVNVGQTTENHILIPR